MSRVTKARWARKLMRARYFVVLTDQESVLALEGVEPRNFDDVIALQAQGAALADFHSKLGVLVADHQKAAQKLLGVKPRSKHATTNRNTPARKGKKITVKEG